MQSFSQHLNSPVVSQKYWKWVTPNVGEPSIDPECLLWSMLIRKMENQASVWLLRTGWSWGLCLQSKLWMGDLRFQHHVLAKCLMLHQLYQKTARKALGTVNRATEKSVKMNGPLKQKQTTSSTKKITEKTVKAKSSVPASDDTYPEIEKFFPFNPLGFESFDLPEEHQITHLPLNGVPLMIFDEERKLEQLLHAAPLRLWKCLLCCGSLICFSLP